VVVGSATHQSRLEKAVGWYVEERESAVFIHAGRDWCVALPTTTEREAYAATVLAQLATRKPILRVPAWLATRPAVLERYEVRRLWPDYVCRTGEMQTMQGGRLKGIRQRVQRLERDGDITVAVLGEADQVEAGELARRWYEQRREALGTMYLFDENVWLFENWAAIVARVPGATGIGVRHQGRLVAANLSCPLGLGSWACHTERYDTTGPTYCNQLAFREACRRVDALALPFVNDGPAEAPYRPGTDDLAAFKHRLAAFELQPYRLLLR
ncbi:MAG: DUF2156 domain-containing protein, partial [Myxococcales bacterium]